MKTSDSTVKIIAPAKKVWLALTVPDLVKQWQYGSDLLTTWEVGSPIIFRNEWNGQVFEQKGNVLEFLPESRVRYSLFVPRPDLQGIPEHYFHDIRVDRRAKELLPCLYVRKTRAPPHLMNRLVEKRVRMYFQFERTR